MTGKKDEESKLLPSFLVSGPCLRQSYGNAFQATLRYVVFSVLLAATIGMMCLTYCIQMARDLMNHLPLRQDQLAFIPELLPPGPSRSLPPSMSLGWVVSIDQIKKQGEAKNLCQQERILEYYPQDDPDRPKEAVFDDESDCYKYEPPPTFSPMQTLDALLDEGKVACGLYKKDNPVYYQDYFTIASIRNTTFGECFENTMFINIYTNIDILKDRSRKGNASRNKADIPGCPEIKAMQEWLGIEEDREPGWWFLSYLWDNDLCDYVRR